MTIETIKTKRGQEYFIVYQVKGLKANGERIVLDTYLNQDAAKNYLNFCKENYSEMYISLYMFEEMVWVK